jgi:hypothetical protein
MAEIFYTAGWTFCIGVRPKTLNSIGAHANEPNLIYGLTFGSHMPTSDCGNVSHIEQLNNNDEMTVSFIICKQFSVQQGQRHCALI